MLGGATPPRYSFAPDSKFDPYITGKFFMDAEPEFGVIPPMTGVLEIEV
jgi:hypothetical protein